MPISRPNILPRLLNFVWETNPQSILDVGIGFGAIGTQFRAIADIRWGRVKDWQVVIDGIEINDSYASPLWKYIYNKIIIGDAIGIKNLVDRKYDIVYLGDILEHLTKEQAKQLIQDSLEIANNYLVCSTPNVFSSNKYEVTRFNSKYEEHLCLLEKSDFPEGSIIEDFDRQSLIIIKKQ